MEQQVIELAAKPDHVPADLVRDFDFYAIPGSADDIQAAYAAVQQVNPDIFWTPRNGGHWVATRYDDITMMQRDTARFSNSSITLPRAPAGTPLQIPLEIDPPIHGEYRRPLMQAMMPGEVKKLEERVRDVAIAQIEMLAARGECEFIEEFAKVMPIHVFMSMVNLPIEDKDFLLPIAERSVRPKSLEDRLAAAREMGAYLLDWVRQRRADPGDDLLSSLVNTKVGGERITEEEAVNYSTLVLFGGLDTVAGMVGLIAKFLAEHPEHRRQIVERLDDEKFLTSAIEELIRRHGIANTSRVITEDFEYKGIPFRKGDIVLPPNLLAGVDDRRNADPLVVDFERGAGPASHAAFGNGPHACPGAILARREIRIFLKEWLSRIPDFRIKPGTTPKLVTGQVNGILELQLVWP